MEDADKITALRLRVKRIMRKCGLFKKQST